MKALRDSTVAIVGLGLMGGSMAFALLAQRTVREVFAVDTNAATRDQAAARGIQAHADLESLSQADIIILAMPVRTIVEQLPRIGAAARASAVVMDLGSTKGAIVQAMQALPASLQPIAGHPMCGRTKSGLEAAEAGLFHNAVFVLTPLARTSPETILLARSLVESVGARPLILDAARHDKLVAGTSHLPYALAATLMATANDLARQDDLLYTLTAGGFRDTSRLAASDTTMMLDILLTNRTNIAGLLRDCAQRLNSLADLIDDGDESALRSLLREAAQARREKLV